MESLCTVTVGTSCKFELVSILVVCMYTTMKLQPTLCEAMFRVNSSYI